MIGIGRRFGLAGAFFLRGTPTADEERILPKEVVAEFAADGTRPPRSVTASALHAAHDDRADYGMVASGIVAWVCGKAAAQIDLRGRSSIAFTSTSAIWRLRDWIPDQESLRQGDERRRCEQQPNGSDPALEG